MLTRRPSGWWTAWPDTGQALLVLSGCIYTALALEAPRLFFSAGIPYSINASYLAAHGTRYMLAHFALLLPALMLVAWALLRKGSAPLRHLCFSERPAILVLSFLLAGIAATMLDGFGLWPWIWRWNPAPWGFAEDTLGTRSFNVAILTLLLFGVVTPILEEIIFRVGVQGVARRWLGSENVAIVVTSMLFTLGHTGLALPTSRGEVSHLSSLFVFSLLLGWITARRDGRAGVAIAMHMGRNTAEQLFLLAAVSASSSPVY